VTADSFDGEEATMKTHVALEAQLTSPAPREQHQCPSATP